MAIIFAQGIYPINCFQLRKISTLILFLAIVLGCSSSIDLEGFNEKAWKSDKEGCHGLRVKLKDDLITVKDQIMGLDNEEVISVLGKPNKTLLDKRNQKYFIYTITPSENCSTYNKEIKSELSLRFSAIGLVYEALID